MADLGFEAQFYGYPMGALIQGVDPNSPASGLLQANDIIVAVGSTQVSSSSQFIHLVEAAREGQAFTVTVYRDRQYQDVTITVGQTQRSALPNYSQDMYY